ncbi:MAG: PQQ-dependent sugar dehydrogenase [Acidobacteriota bacterium]
MELTLNGEKVVSQRRFLELGKRIRDVRAGYDDKSLWVLTDDPAAELYQITQAKK